MVPSSVRKRENLSIYVFHLNKMFVIRCNRTTRDFLLTRCCRHRRTQPPSVFRPHLWRIRAVVLLPPSLCVGAIAQWKFWGSGTGSLNRPKPHRSADRGTTFPFSVRPSPRPSNTPRGSSGKPSHSPRPQHSTFQYFNRWHDP